MSNFKGLTLQQYIEAKRGVCLQTETIIRDGHMKLTDAFHTCSPRATYKSSNVKRMLLQMPLATLTVGETGNHHVYLVDKSINITLIGHALESFHKQPNDRPMAKDILKRVLKAAQNNQEKERIRYKFCK